MSGTAASDLRPALPADALAGPVPPSSRTALVLRVALLGCFLLSVLHAWQLPAERTTGHLLTELSDGTVESVSIERPPPDMHGLMSLRVEWTVSSGRDGYAYYDVTVPEQPSRAGQPTTPGQPTTGLDRHDEGELILAAATTSPARVQVTTVEPLTLRPTLVVNWPAVVGLGALLVLVTGPQPRLATKWAWFWLAAAVPVLGAVFLLLEPVPAWRRTPMTARSQRYTGGWAFLAALLLGSLWHSLAPS